MKKIVWLDLETTGLNPKSDIVLSLGIRITGPDLVTIAEAEWDVRTRIRELNRVESCTSGWQVLLPEVVFDMHTKSGLLARLPTAPFDWHQVCGLAWTFLAANLGADKGILAGSSVHFDKAFLAEHAPELLKFVGYRLLDTSVFKVIADTWAPEKAQPKSEPAHTPLADIEASIGSLRHYVAAFGMPIQFASVTP